MTMFRQSIQRKSILEYLETHPTHPKAAEIHAALRAKISTLSLGTVYRNLEILARQGKVRSLGLGQPEARFDATMEPHGHFICTECGTVLDIQLQPGCCKLARNLAGSGYLIINTNLELAGICPTCQHHQSKRREHHG